MPRGLENIFKRLYRVETSRNMKTGGHGLGLAIARELAHQWVGKSQSVASTASEAPLPSFSISLAMKIKLKTPLQI